jgi:hypothetical protein
MADQPATGAMDKLQPLVGRWMMEATVQGQVTARARCEFDWLDDGAFLIQRVEAEPPPPDIPREWVDNAPFPIVTVIGLDDHSGRFFYNYSDGRGVRRVYEMSLDDRVWRLWGQAKADFFQRFAGTFAPDGNTISGRWERSVDGSAWELDFEGAYTRVG